MKMTLAVALSFLVADQLSTLKLGKAQGVIVKEQAPYDVIKKGEGYEERYYPPAHWVCHSKTLKRPRMSRLQQSFFPLFHYITGANEKGINISMTEPVSAVMIHKATDGVWDTQMCFYLPKAQQVNTTAPNNPQVYIEARLAKTVFVRRVGGFLTRASQWEYQAMQLKTALQDKEPAADFSFYYMASYDVLLQFGDRRNELWYVKKERM